MTKNYKELKEYLIKCSNSYYKDSISIISDYDFDMKLKQLEEIEKAQGFADPDSPTQKPGSDLVSASKKHDRPMLSLENTYSFDELEPWCEKMFNLSSNGLTVEKKFDGGSAAIKFKDGKVIQALTRGDGEVGEDITENVKLLNWKNIKKEFTGEVRGELIISKDGFKKLNSEGKYQNARNLLSGSMKLLDHMEFSKRAPYILFKAYFLENSKMSTHKDSMDFLKKMGFDADDVFIAKDYSDVKKYIEKIDADKDSYDVEIDGAVMKVNQLSAWQTIGSTKKCPKWAKAYKYKQEEAETKVLSITYQVGMSGKITPVCNFEPVFIDGSTISSLTLNNKDYMEELDIRVGDIITVHKAAAIIPECTGIVKHQENSVKTEFTKVCPICGKPIKKLNKEHADYYCVNDKCPGKLVAVISHFTHTMEIDGFSDVTIQKLIDKKIINSVEDLYTLKHRKDELVIIDRFGDKLVSKLIDNIEASKNCEFYKMLGAIGIPNVGVKTAKVICKKYPTPEKLNACSKIMLQNIPGIGDITAEFLYNEIHNEKSPRYKTYHKLSSDILIFKGTEKSSKKLAGKKICITGKLDKPRGQYEKMIEAAGGENMSSVSKNTDFLVNNDPTSTSSKNVKAGIFGVKIISEAELINLLK